MTQPTIDTVKKSGTRFYVDPNDADNRLPGVTSILNMLPKPFLQYWRAKVVAECAADNLEIVTSMMLKGEREAAIDYLKKSPQRSTGNSATIGTDVHNLCERIARGEDVGRVHPDHRPYLVGFESFIKDFEPEFLFVEETVWSDTHKYAGSFDAIVKIDGETICTDVKTTRSGVHSEVALQLSAYSNADHILKPDGSTVPIPTIDSCAVIHLRPERAQLVPVSNDPSLFDTFKSLRTVWEWDQGMSKRAVGKPVGSWDIAEEKKGR